MRWTITFVLVVPAFIALVFWYLKDPGHVAVTWFGFEYESTALIAFILSTIFVFIFILCINILLWIMRIPNKIKSYFYRSKESKAENELLALCTAYEAEMFKEARFHQQKAALTLSSNPFFLWYAGNVNLKMNDFLEARQCFFELSRTPATAFLGLKGAIRSALHHSDFKGAYGLLERAEKIIPNSPWVLNHHLTVARNRKDYKKAEEIILRLEDLGRLTPEQSKRQIGHLFYAQTLEPETSEKDKEILLRQAHKLDPAHIDTTIALSLLYLEQGDKKIVKMLIEDTWALSPNQRLGDLYLSISEPQNELAGYQTAATLVQKTINNPISLLFLAQTALKANLWSEARAQLTKLKEQDPSVPIHDLMARLELEERQDIRAALRWLSSS